jgi:hypothetical protein
LALSNYTELQAAVADWANRTDLTSRIPDFITLAEREIARRLRKTTVRAALSLDTQEVSLPTDCEELRSIRLDTDLYKHNIEIGTPEMLAERRKLESGLPFFGAVVNNVLLLECEPRETFNAEIVYYQKLVPLATTATNDLFAASPDLYLWGALREVALFLEQDERFAQWDQRFQMALDAEETRRQNAEYGASLTPVRLPVSFG